MKKIAVHLHLFYIDLLEEFLYYFNNIPYPFDLYISCPHKAQSAGISGKARQALPQVEDVVVRECRNQGRDIAPFYILFAEELQQYEYILHVHSKKSKHMEEGGSSWRQYSLDSLAGSRQLVKSIIGIFDEKPDIGLVYPDWHPDIPMIGYTWMANRLSGRQLLTQLGLPYHEGLFNYPAGSFFWVRTEAIRPIFELNLGYKDFPKEAGQIEGTIAHALERVIAFVVKGLGYHSGIVDIDEKAMRIDRSVKPFRRLFELTLNDAKEYLCAYESISFGVFDTLLAVTAFSKDDIIRLTAERAGLDHAFIELRKLAEEIVRSRSGDRLNIDDIYSELVLISPFDKPAAMQLKQYEIECLMSHVIPREDVRVLYQYLIQKGKKVSIVCDSYYHRKTIETLLVRYGFIGYDKIWVSSEYGVSKSNERIWELLYSKYDEERHIHIGSDIYADWYTLEKRGSKVMYIMGGKQSYYYSLYNEDIREEELSLEESLDLGRKVNRDWFNSPFSLSGNPAMKLEDVRWMQQ